MIASRGFRPVGWVAALGAAALCCYMLSLRVASERADLVSLDRKIVAAERNIRTLQTEVGTRSRIPQLEDWNDDVLSLSAPVSGQFVEGNVSLARFDMRAPQLADQTEVRLASADTAAPARPEPAPAAPSAMPAPQHAVGIPGQAQRPEVRRASLTVGVQDPVPAKLRAAPARTREAADEERVRPGPAPRRTAARDERARPAAAPTRIARAEPPRIRPGATLVRAASTTAPPRARPAVLRAVPGPSRPARNAVEREPERGAHN